MGKNNKILIGLLLAALIIMTVGYAAFSASLKINGTGEVSSNWQVGLLNNGGSSCKISNAKENTLQDCTSSTKPTGSITFSNNLSSNSTLSLNAQIEANLYSPNDKVTYTFTLSNLGDLDATVVGPTLNIANDDKFITYSISKLGSTTESKLDNSETVNLDAKTSKTFIVTVKYNDVKDANGNSIQPTFNKDTDGDGVNDIYQISGVITFNAYQSVN